MDSVKIYTIEMILYKHSLRNPQRNVLYIPVISHELPVRGPSESSEMH